MPELPEVETIRRQLAPLVERRRLLSLEILDSRWTRPLEPGVVVDALEGRRVEELGRQRARARRLAIVDPRRFGTGDLLLGTDAVERFFAARLGLEPFDQRFTPAHLGALMRGRRTPVKALLLDQRRIAGVGNIYADEALFRARVHPLRPAGRLDRAQVERLHEAVIAALSAGIDARGATIDDFRHVDGVRGSFQDQFLVHLRAGEPCVRCGHEIVKLVVAGRGTYVCERCQARPRRVRRRAGPPGDRPRPRPAPR